MTFDFHPEARLEYREAAAFYESRRHGLGAAFSLEVEATIDRILETPTRWRQIEQDIHSCRTHTFPYSILYSLAHDSVLIVAVMHLRRKPGYWRERLPSGNR
jgi:plasmid stabilization system protein ParE